jgi:hypothetical protein
MTVDIKDQVPQREMPYVIVRTYSAGVHVGYLKSREGREVVLTNARRIFRWAGALTLSELAQIGSKNIKECKISIEVDEILLLEAIEVISTTKEAEEQLKSAPRFIPEGC